MSHVQQKALNPLYVLREHSSSLLSCAFFPSEIYMPSFSNLFLSCDAGGQVILSDLSLRKSIFAFSPVDERAIQQSTFDPREFMFSNPGVLHVGFLSWNIDSLDMVDNEQVEKSDSNVQVNHPPSRELTLTSNANETKSNTGRQRFRLKRNVSKTQQFRKFSLYFFTQCRNQKLYIWELNWNAYGDGTNTTQYSIFLLYELNVPQHGFCQVAHYVESDGKECYIYIPQSADGKISVWKTDLVKNETNSITIDGNTTTTHSDSDVEVDTTGMNEMDALIARSAAREEKEKKKMLATGTIFAEKSNSAFVRGPKEHFTHSFSLNLSYVCTFSAAPGVKCGLIMSLSSKKRGEISCSFESGHVSLIEQRTRKGENSGGGESLISAEMTLLTLTRAFPESALTCLWSESYVISTSAEGTVHCYHLLREQTAVMAPNNAQEEAPAAQMILMWETQMSRGLGSVALQQYMLILGCWDGTLRLFDVRTGNPLSLLPFHYENSGDAHHFGTEEQHGTVNAISLAPRGVVEVLPFAYNARVPSSYYQKQECISASETLLSNDKKLLEGFISPKAPKIREEQKEDEIALAASSDCAKTCALSKFGTHLDNVYIFASAGKDSSIALWRVDLRTI